PETPINIDAAIHNIEITLGKGGQLARATSAVAELIAKEEKSATLKLPSGEARLISKNCSATIQQVGNAGVMNPVDHPREVVKGGPQLVDKNLQHLEVILHLKEEVEDEN
ncbi:50S ribosomal protein L2, chloroplastic, partial [Cucurbita argyrosperma subsp. argyrosperma]